MSRRLAFPTVTIPHHLGPGSDSFHLLLCLAASTSLREPRGSLYPGQNALMQMRGEAAARKASRMHFDKLEVIVAAMLLDSSAERQLRELLRDRGRVLASGTAEELIHTLGSTHVDLVVCALAHPIPANRC